ncbi:hypothetical protein KIL84_018234 [Mauremys mutica]|uniref:Uncharacterized protein n=1 Tax=Mauremys mutica TaxID=74926 RepID=A0A9D3XUK1_9SAUR|nr:hypothetical protein KIL84_018234 [Mauremys mutica]
MLSLIHKPPKKHTHNPLNIPAKPTTQLVHTEATFLCTQTLTALITHMPRQQHKPTAIRLNGCRPNQALNTYTRLYLLCSVLRGWGVYPKLSYNNPLYNSLELQCPHWEGTFSVPFPPRIPLPRTGRDGFSLSYPC